MPVSRSVIQSSTLRPTGLMGSTKATISFSADTISVICRSSSKVTRCMASKHFLRCGCTLCGSLVSDRISSSSSLERK
jgi:hypothetical protein